MRAVRFVLCLLLVICVSAGATACGRKKNLPDDATLLAEAERLIRASVPLDRLFFVEGLPATEGQGVEGYVPVDTSALAAGFSSYAGVCAYAHEIYSDALFESFEGLGIRAVTDGSQLIRRAYCYDKTDKNGNPQEFLVSTAGLHKQMDAAEYHLSTLRVKDKSASTARLTVEATVTSHDTAETQRRTVTVALVLEDGVWKLDTLTCLTYHRDSYPPLS